MRTILALLASTALLHADLTPEQVQKIFGNPTLDNACPTYYASTFFQVPVSAESGEVKPAGGISLRGIFWHGFGAQMELIQSATEDTFVDRTALHGVYRLGLTDRVAAIGFGGIGRDWEDTETGLEFGGGIEYSIGAGIDLGASIRWQKDDTDEHILVPTLSLGYKF